MLILYRNYSISLNILHNKKDTDEKCIQYYLIHIFILIKVII